MALPTVTQFTRILAATMTAFKNHLEGQVGSTAPWHFRQSTGNFQVTLSEAAGATQVRINDSAGSDIFHIDSDGNVVAAGSIGAGSVTFPGSITPAQTAEGSAVWDTDDDVLTVGDGASRKTFGYIASTVALAGGTASGGTSKEVARVDHVHPAGSTALITEITSTVLLAFTDFTSLGASAAATTPQAFPGIGLDRTAPSASGIFTPAATPLAGGAVAFKTGTTSGSVVAVGDANAVNAVQASKNPYYIASAKVGAGAAALAYKFFGFFDVTPGYATAGTSTTNNKAGFRAVTTGNIFFVTGNATSEQTTDTGIAQDATTLRKFEVYTTDAGVTWKGYVDGVLKATHTTQVPVANAANMGVQMAIVNNTTTDVQITAADYMGAYQTR